MVSHIDARDTNPEATGTSGEGGIGGAVMNMGLGQMKFDAPPRYGGGRHPSVHVWLGLMERYMRLTNCPPRDWLDIVALRVEGAASAWLNATLVSIEQGW